MKLLDAGRGAGIETAIQAALELIQFRWLHSEEEDGWRSFSDGLLAGDIDWSESGEIGSATPSSARLPPSIQVALIKAFDVVPEDTPQNKPLQEFLEAVFEALLTRRESTLSRAGASQATRPEIAQLIAAIVGDGPRLLDPACGVGTTLLLASRSVKRELVVGFDINSRVSMIAEARLELAGVSAVVQSLDWLGSPDRGEWDAICLEPPFSMTMTADQLAANPTFSARSSSKSDMAWLLKASRSLSPSGVAVVMLPGRTLNSSGDASIRAQLLARGRIESIIALPSGSALGTSIDTCLWVIRQDDQKAKRERVLLVNGEAILNGGQAGSEAIQRIVDVVLRWRRESKLDAPRSFARVVSQADLSRSGDFRPVAHLQSTGNESDPHSTVPARGLSALTLSNFKSVGSTTTAELRPLTLIYGRNSAGKSTLIQSLLLLRASLGQDRLVARGHGFDLGSFRGLVHGQDESKSVTIGLEFGAPRAADIPATSIPSPSLIRRVDLSFGQDSSRVARLQTISTTFANERFDFARSFDDPDDGTFRIPTDHVQRAATLFSSNGALFPADADVAARSGKLGRTLTPTAGASFRVGSTGGLPNGAVELVGASPALRPRVELPNVEALVRLLSTAWEEVASILQTSVYLGPMREAPTRFSDGSMSTGGLDIPRFLLDNSSEREDVSLTMKRLGMSYELDVLTLSESIDAHVMGELVAVILRDSRSGVALSTADVGYGISQVLPILVELSARRESLILIEQPEIHLHPALQSELADIMIESVDEAGRGNQVIAETHSEHLVLRVQRRVRERQLDPDLVSILYVDQDESGQASVQRLRLDARGEFQDEWPNGFFVDRFDELFAGLE